MSTAAKAALGDRVALVTGGTRGIGLGIVEALLAAGARVALVGRTEAAVLHAHERLTATGPVARWAADLSEPGAPADVVARTVATFGRIDILINNAGITGAGNFWNVGAEEWDRVQNVNLRAAFFLAREAALHMKAAGQGGSIVNLASVAGQIGGVATGPAYVASNAGLIGLTKLALVQFA